MIVVAGYLRLRPGTFEEVWPHMQAMIAAGYDLREAEKAIKSLMGDGADEDDSLGGAVFGDHSSKARRMQRLRNLIIARYGRQDYSRAVRTTLAYERASLNYR